MEKEKDDCVDLEKQLNGCLLSNTREGAWPYNDCKTIVEKYDKCKNNVSDNSGKEEKPSPAFQ